MSYLHKEKYDLSLSIARYVRYLLFSTKNLVKNCSTFEDLPADEVSCSHFEWWTFCIYFRSLCNKKALMRGQSFVLVHFFTKRHLTI